MKKKEKYVTRYLSLTKQGKDRRLKKLRSSKPNRRFTAVRNSSKNGYWIYEYVKPKTKKKK